MQNNYLNHKKIYKTKKKITRFEFTPDRIGERGARYSPEQSHGAAVQGGCGATNARRRGRDVRTTQRWRAGGRNRGARWRDGGRNDSWTVARRWRDSSWKGARRWRDGASFSPAVRWRSKTGDPNFVDGGAIGDGEVADGEVARERGREREDDEQ